MKGLELLNAYIDRLEEEIMIAENEIHNNATWTGNAGRAWPAVKAKNEKILKVFKSIKSGLAEDYIRTTKIRRPDVYSKSSVGISDDICWTNYRCILLWNTETFMVDPFFWTPKLKGVQNSHHDLMAYALMRFRKEAGGCIYNPSYRWGGFYTYGLGNGDQKQLTFYGESSDYPHDKYSDMILEHYLQGKQILPIDFEYPDDPDDLPF